MSDALPDPAVDLLDVDPDEWDDEEALREYVDEQLADLRRELDEQGARDDALSRKIDAVRETARQAERRAERAELVASWGGIGYDDRLAQVVETLLRRAEPRDSSRSSIATVERVVEDLQGNRYRQPGVYDLFDGSLSKRTCRSYIDDLSRLPGFSVERDSRGGYGGGGSDPKRLRLDREVFERVYGEDWTIDDLIADIREAQDA